MTSICRASGENFRVLADIAKQSYIESHGKSAAPADIEMYINRTLNYNTIKDELNEKRNIYHIMYYDHKPAGYSKIILNAPDLNIQFQDVTKLERLYLLEQFYSLKIGFELLQFNIELSKQNKQAGMWLFVWKGNQRAINFYGRMGFQIIGSYNFKLTETHFNPNHQMFLKY
jgi:ribosomal protein S18 acetylase RimI-like enzyme